MVERAEWRQATQARGLETRAKLLDAALECLVERGYSATTTTEVARRAGVSRGAQLHHFPTKESLLTAAVDQLFERRTSEFSKAIANLDPGADQVDAAIDVLWEMFRGPTFIAWLELWVAARTDPALKATVIEVDERFIQRSVAVYAEHFPPVKGEDTAFAELSRAFAFVVLAGLALQQIHPHDYEGVPDHIVDALKLIAHTFTADAQARRSTQGDSR